MMFQKFPHCISILIIFSVTVYSDQNFTTSSNLQNASVRFMNISITRLTPSSLLITWNGLQIDQPNITVQIRQKNQTDWSILDINSTENSYILNLSDPCANYEIRLEISDQKTRYISERKNIHPIPIPDRLSPIRPQIVKNIYDNRWDIIHLEFSLQSDHNLSLWEIDPNFLTVRLHVVNCDGGNFMADIPSIHWISKTIGEIGFGGLYVKHARMGYSCKIMIYIRQWTKICHRILNTDSDLLTNSIMAAIDCKNTVNLNCTQKIDRNPNCRPNFLEAFENGTEIRVKWKFDENDPSNLIIRYGFIDNIITENELNSALTPMRQLGKFQLNSIQKNISIPLNITGEKRRYQIQICKVFDGSETNEIDWAIVPKYIVKNMEMKEEHASMEECQCKSEIPLVEMEDAEVAVVPPEPINISPSSILTYEGLWIKAAPLLASFILFTIINISLFIASYCYYNRAKRANKA